MVPVDTTLATVQITAVKLFFPGGLSPKGRIEQFAVALLNFDKSELHSDETVAMVYERKK